MLDRWIVNLVLMFVLKELATFRELNDWGKLKADADALIRRLIPGTFFDAPAAALVLALISAAEGVLGAPTALEAIGRMLAGGDFQSALETLKRLLISQWWPADEADKRAAKALVA